MVDQNNDQTKVAKDLATSNQETHEAAMALMRNLEEQIFEKNKLLIEKEKELLSMKSRSLKVYEENESLKASPQIAAQRADMEYMLAMADRFIKSGAFNVKNAEQAFTIMKAGKEMGLSEVESLNALYIVNGTINFYGKHMVAKLTNLGYKIEYLEETNKSVKVRIHNDKGFDVTETVSDADQILLKSKAMSFAKKNKMRYHGIRMIINFHLPHHFGSVSDMMSEDYREVEDKIKPYELQQISDMLNSFGTIGDLEAYYEENKAIISKDIELTMQVGRLRKQLIPEDAQIVS